MPQSGPPLFSESARDEVARYVRNECMELARDLIPKTKIYLDTKYWVSFRDVRLGRCTSATITELLTTIAGLVSAQKVVCPLNADVFFEILKQQDPETLLESVKLLDELSMGACLLPMPDRVRLEIAHFVESTARGSENVYALRELVWTKSAYVLGFATPDCPGWSRNQSIEIQKRFFDYVWGKSLSDILTTMGSDYIARRASRFRDISGQLNHGKHSAIDEHTSFKSVLLSEIDGIADVYRGDLEEYLRYRTRQSAEVGRPENDVAIASSNQILADFIGKVFRNDSATVFFPTIRISAGLHAAVRWDRHRNYKPNDMFDFRHAEAALPYCDYFFTEHSLRHLLHDRNLGFEKHFSCKVVSEPSEALDIVAEIATA